MVRCNQIKQTSTKKNLKITVDNKILKCYTKIRTSEGGQQTNNKPQTALPYNIVHGSRSLTIGSRKLKPATLKQGLTVKGYNVPLSLKSIPTDYKPH